MRWDVGFCLQSAEEGAGAGDGGIGAFHGLDCDAGLGGDDDGLAEIVGGDGLGDGASVGDVLLFLFVGCSEGEDAGFCEERLEVLDARMSERGIDKEHYAWYRDLRRYGTVPHAGFGLGFERTLAYVTGLANVRDAIPFPRTPGHARY